MQSDVSLAESPVRAPRLAGWLRTPLEWLDRGFDRAYGSSYNPLYRSGTLATGLLTLVTVTGVYLLLFYRLSAPYESVAGIAQQLWAGRWIRSLHRYASDAAVAAIAFHALRMLVEGKTWGPRFLAWISGVILVGMLLLSGWTGYILIWDRHGQAIALAGARLLDLLPVLAEPLSRAFSGGRTLASSFYFMNLFLHVGIPLMMLLALWIHTSRLARSAWLPNRRTLGVVTGLLFTLSVLWPAPLAGPADLLLVGGRFPIDGFFSFWLPFDWYGSPGWDALAWLGFMLVPLSVPFWWRPARAPETSRHDELKCEGCNQCATDCPFEAIAMVPRTQGTGSALVAHVNRDLCVSCGICAGSCTQFAIGPPGRSGREQLAALKPLKDLDAGAPGANGGIALVFCANNPSQRGLVERFKGLAPRVVACGVECVGSLHAGVVTSFFGQFDGVYLLGCPEALCQQREGHDKLTGRLYRSQGPTLPARVDRSKVRVATGTSADTALLSADFRAFGAYLSGTAARPPAGISPMRGRAPWFAAFTAGILLLLGAGTRIEAGRVPTESFLRLSWRLPGQVHETCRDFTAAELQGIPAHMRKPRDCHREALPYLLRAEVDGRAVTERQVVPRGARGDRPLIVEFEVPVEPGRHRFRVSFAPVRNDAAVPGGENHAVSLEKEFTGDFQAGRALLVGYEYVSQSFVVRN